MKLKLLPWLLAAVVLGLPAATAAETTWYAERISSGDAPVRVEYFWSKGPSMRSETVIRGHPIVTIVNGEQYMIIDRVTHRGVSIQRSPRAIAEDATRARPFGNELQLVLANGGEKVRAEAFGAGTCDLYRLTNGEGRREVCVSQDEQQLPLLLRVWLRRTSQQQESRYLEWSRDILLDDAVFEADPRVELEHLTYDQYVARATKEVIGPAPPLHADLLHGS